MTQQLSRPTLRCFSVYPLRLDPGEIAAAKPRQMLHLNSRAQFASLTALQRSSGRAILAAHIHALLFVKPEHLPPELSSVRDLEGFDEVCHQIAFAEIIYILKKHERLIETREERITASRMPCTGFPLTRPVAPDQVEAQNPFSFIETEQRSLLGDKMETLSGHSMVISLNPPAPHIPLETSFHNTVAGFLRELQK